MTTLLRCVIITLIGDRFMNYLESHLSKDEKIVARTRKSAFIFMRDVLLAALLVGVALGIQFGFKIDMNVMRWVYIAIILVVLLAVADTTVKYASTLLAVSNKRFMFKEDIITIKVFDAQLRNVDCVEVEYRTPLRRALNVGDITVRTRSSVHTFTNVARPDRFSAVLNKRAADVQDGCLSRANVTFGITKSNPPYVKCEKNECAESAR